MICANDWEIKRCLSLSLATLLASLGLVGLAGLGFDIPGLRQIVGFIFLTFVPGILILRILKIHNVGIIQSLLYSVGLSLSFVMVSGLFINFALPVIGISRPISIFPIVATLTIFTIILMAVAYKRDKGFSASTQSGLAEILSPSSLFLILVLFLAIFGALMVNFYQSNILLLVFILAVAGVVGLAAFGKFIHQGVYPLAIAIIALCLLYQTTFISPYLTGTDIHFEYYYTQLVVENGYWDSAIPHNYNSALSIVILAPIYSLILNIDGAWLFKAVYPFIFSLMPLALFYIYRQQMSAKKAFLAAFFFLAVPTFSLELVAVAKQQIAELFFALFILLLVDRKLGLGQRLTLAIVFALSLAVSHYGLGSICLFYFGLGWLLLVVIRSGWGRRTWGWLTKKLGGLSTSLISPRALPLKAIGIVVVIYFVGSLAYYGWAASGMPLATMTSIWQRQTAIVTGELPKLVPSEPSTPGEPAAPAAPSRPSLFLDPTAREPLIQAALGLDFASASSQGKGFRILQYITQLFIIVGLIRLVFKPKRLRFVAEYIAFAVVSILLLLAFILLPKLSYQFNITRLYHIALFFLAPLCILGGEFIWLGLLGLARLISSRGKLGTRPSASADMPTESDNERAYLRFIALAVLVPYFLVTSGFIFEVSGQEVTDRVDAPYSIALSSHRLDIAGVFNRQDGAAAEWLADRFSGEHPVYADLHGVLLLIDQVELQGQISPFPLDKDKWHEYGYIYLRTRNVEKHEAVFYGQSAGLRKTISFSQMGLPEVINGNNRIYNNGGAQVLAQR